MPSGDSSTAVTECSFKRSLLCKPFERACAEAKCGTASATAVVTTNRDESVNRGFMGRYSIVMRAGLLPIVAAAFLDWSPAFELGHPELFSTPSGLS